MLVIRRKAGEGFRIGDSIEVEILEVGANQVKIGIRAPREIAVLRNEVFLTETQNKAAAKAAAALMTRLSGPTE
jgi:carbon storage regulator